MSLKELVSLLIISVYLCKKTINILSKLPDECSNPSLDILFRRKEMN